MRGTNDKCVIRNIFLRQNTCCGCLKDTAERGVSLSSLHMLLYENEIKVKTKVVDYPKSAVVSFNTFA